ncbi:ATP-binding protein [Streptomyces sp. NPDC020681]|uniref:ATP-binding protein n=1 Tax=Streptomyces sp. NPDC020681 TaxID=3365083 RepID=UPI0037918857
MSEMELQAKSIAMVNVGGLPHDSTSFVGRQRQISEANRLLSASRLLTFTGPGGVGKTRLAVRFADAKRRTFRDGVRFVGLEELRDPKLLANTVADKLGLRDQSSRSATDTVIDHLRGCHLLLVLDNCEHLIDDCAVFVGALIRGCPHLRVLATSRQSLGVYGETTLIVPPLQVPDPEKRYSLEALSQFDSVRMFTDRAVTAFPEFEVTDRNRTVLARLCSSLDGIPLAIELAAALLRVLSLEQIDERLSARYRLLSNGPRDAPSRQRTLRALIDWSYDLCSAREQIVWACASVFDGSFDLAAVEQVAAGETVTAEEMPEVIGSLLDKSILFRQDYSGTVRYRMLETLREYGQERLIEAGEYIPARRRHRNWYTGLTEQFGREWIGPGQEAWIDRLRREHPNLRVALDFCLTQGEAATALPLITRIEDYWTIHGYFTEARHWLDQALAAAPEPTRERCTALCVDGWYALVQGDVDAGMSLLAEATELTEQRDYQVEGALATLIKGMAGFFTGDLENAALLFESALARFRADRERRGELFALFIFGLVLSVKGELDRGLALLDECLTLTSQRGELFWRSYTLWAVCWAEMLNDQLERADTAGKESLRSHRMGAKPPIALTMGALAWVAERQGRHVRSATLFGIAATVWNEVGGSTDFYVPIGAADDEHIALARAALGDDGFEAAFQQGRHFSGAKAMDYALETKPKAPSRSNDAESPLTSAESPLTLRERQVAELIVEGMSDKEIAATLVISRRTAEAHVQHILVKLGFASRAQVAAWATAQQSRPPTADH